MPKSVHMHVKNFTYIASTMHVKCEIHMHYKIVSHVWKDFTCNKLHGKKVHTYDKNFSHVLQNFTRMSKSSHACEMLMWWTCIFANIDFTWFLFFTHFSHPFHMIFTHVALVVKKKQQDKTEQNNIGWFNFNAVIQSQRSVKNPKLQWCSILEHQ